MLEIGKMESLLLGKIAGIEAALPEGAVSLRMNGKGAVRHSSENITIEAKTDKPGINIFVKPGTKGETGLHPRHDHGVRRFGRRLQRLRHR